MKFPADNAPRTRPGAVLRHRAAAIVSVFFAVPFLLAAFGPHFDGLRTRHVEYVQKLPLFVALSAVCVAIAGALLFLAWKLWRKPSVDEVPKTRPAAFQRPSE